VSQRSKFLGNPFRALSEYQVQTNFVAASFQAQDFELLAAGDLRIVCIDTRYMRTYTVGVNVTLSIDEQLVTRARKKADALGKSLNQLIRDYLQRLAGGDDPERSIEEFKRLSGRGHSRGWRFNRNEIHERS